MSLFSYLFNFKKSPASSYDVFWNWFCKNEKSFFKVVKERVNIENGFFNKLSPKLNAVKDGFFFLTGMYDEQTVELIITADGAIKNIVFVEELVRAAPIIPGWKFTALKPAMDIKDVNIETSELKFSKDNMSFYANVDPDYPDQIDLTIVYKELNEQNRTAIINGIYIFLDSYLGELPFATKIDDLSVVSNAEEGKELIPIEKLKNFLSWRQKEFIEKYEGIRHDTENDNYTKFKAKVKNGNTLLAVVNTDLLEWDGKASHPWILNVEICYDGRNNNGVPDEDTVALLQKIENGLLKELKDFEGYLNIGKQTGDNMMEIYFACKDFRKPSKVLHLLETEYSDLFQIKYDIFKDKYWRLFNRFRYNR